MKKEALSREAVLERLGEELGVEVRFTEEEDPADAWRRRIMEVLERTSHYYHSLLARSPGAEYLAARGVTAAEAFRLGWAPASGDSLAQRLKGAGYTVEEGLAAGVLLERNGRVVDTLRNRVVFPISDAQDRVLAFGGRTLQADVQPKYLNTPETQVYSKRRHLYGLNINRQAISKSDRAVVVEGYLDVIGLHQVGLGWGVASLGTALTPEQCRLLGQYTRNVTLAYDADRAGAAATLKGIELFEEARLDVSIAVLPPGDDPDSLARRAGREGVEECLGAAVEAVEHHLRRWEAEMDLTTPTGKARFMEAVQPMIFRIRDETKRGALLRQLATKLHLTEAQLHWRFRTSHGAEAPRQRAMKLDPEAMLFRVLAQYPQWVERARGGFALEDLSREPLRPLFAYIFGLEERNGPLSLEDFADHVEEESLLGELLIEEPPPSAPEDVDRLVKAIRDRGDRVRFERLRREIVQATAEGTLNSEDESFQEYLRLQKRLKGS